MSSTTLTEANLRPTQTVKSKNFSIRKHDVVGLIFGLIVISPVWLALLLPNLVSTVRNTYGATQPILILTALDVLVVLLGGICVALTMPKEGAK